MTKFRIPLPKLLVCALLLAASPGNAGATGTGGLTRLEQLDTAANVLMSAVDHPGEACGIAADEARILLPALQARIDPLLEKETALRLNRARARKTTVSDPSWVNRCAASCHCGLYSRILQRATNLAGGRGLGSADSEVLTRLQKEASATPDEQVRQCATAAKWFCSSPLLHDLRKAASEFQPADSKY